MKEKIIESITRIEKISNEILQTKEKIENEKLERYFCNLEKARMDMYDEVNQENLWRKFMGDEIITEYIDDEYKVKLEGEILKIYIPEKVPSIKKGANYTRKTNYK